MATGSNGLIYENRTLQFYGFAYGNTTVSLKATINGTDVFTGEVATINAELPPPPLDMLTLRCYFLWQIVHYFQQTGLDPIQ